MNVNSIGYSEGSNFFVNNTYNNSIKNLPAYREFYSRWQSSGSNCSFIAWCEMKGYATELYRQLENYIETGDPYKDDTSRDTINECKQLSNGTSSLYQADDGENFFEIDWKTGEIKLLNKEEVLEIMGIDTQETYDTFSLGYNCAVITDYTFGDLHDGQDKKSKDITPGKYGNKVKFVEQEFDLDYIFNELYNDDSDPQRKIAENILNDLVKNSEQWLSAAELEELGTLQEEYGENSPQYKNRLKQLMLANLDQTNAWREGHAHLDRTVELDLSQFAPKNEEEGVVPTYDIDALLKSIDMYEQYYGNTTYNCGKHYDNNTCEQSAADDARTYVDEQLSKLINAMVQQMGDECTEDVYLNMLKAKAAIVGSFCESHGSSNWGGKLLCGIGAAGVFAVLTIASGGTLAGLSVGLSAAIVGVAAGGIGAEFYNLCEKDSEGIKATAANINDVISVKTFGGGMFSDWGARGQVNEHNMVDQFLRVFESLCRNKGKTDEQVEIEKAEKAESYQKLKSINYTSEANSAGIRNVNVVNAGLSEIWQKANDAIIAPLKERIKSRMQGSDIPEDELQEILDYAGVHALDNPEKWATLDYSGYTYTINAAMLTNRFERIVKEIAKTKGY